MALCERQKPVSAARSNELTLPHQAVQITSTLCAHTMLQYTQYATNCKARYKLYASIHGALHKAKGNSVIGPGLVLAPLMQRCLLLWQPGYQGLWGRVSYMTMTCDTHTNTRPMSLSYTRTETNVAQL